MQNKEKNKKNKKIPKNGKEVPVQKEMIKEKMKKMLKRSPSTGQSDAIKVSAKDGQSYADILKEMKARVNPQDSGLEVLSVRRTRKEEVLLVLKKGDDIPAFQKALDQAVGARAKIDALVSRRSLDIRDLDKTVEKEEVVAALAGALGTPDLDGHCWIQTRFGGVRTAVVRLADADASRLL